MKSFNKVTIIQRSVCMTILCTAATMMSTIAQLNLAVHAFVPQKSIITTRKSIISPIPILVPPNKHTTTTPVNKNNNNLLLLLQHYYQPPQSRNIRHSIMTPNMASSSSSATSTSSDEDLENEIQSMKAKDIRQELESYGIGTKSFFEKSELVEALLKARKEGKTPMNNVVNGDLSDDAAAAATTTTDASSSSGNNNSSSSTNRQERLNQEMEKCKSMKV
ncbi:hypothetical protein ACHAXM_008132, partial [Skeletonema potamos]